METILFIGLFVICLIVVLAVVAGVEGANQRKAAEEALANLRAKYALDEAYVSPFGMDCVGLNWDERRLYSGKAPDGVVTYSFEQLRSSEIEVDGVTITRTDSTNRTRRGSQLGGAAVGGLIFGPAGLLVGGLTGGSKTTSATQDTQHVCSIALLLRFNDRTNPIQQIKFWDMAPPGIARHNALLKPITDKANRFHALMVQIIEEHAGAPRTEDPADIPDKLEKLWALRQAGALSQTEFEKQKRALLSGP